MSDLAAAVAAVTDLVSSYGGTRDEMVALLSGPADGGPAGDGLYPVTTPAGGTIKAPSPLKLLASGAAVDPDLLVPLVERAEAANSGALAEANRAAQAANTAGALAGGLAALLPVMLASTTINQHDPNRPVLGHTGFEISSEDGKIIPFEGSAISNLVDVRGWDAVTVGYLPPVTYDRFYSWLRLDGSVADFGFVDKAAASFTKPCPPGAAYFVFDWYRRIGPVSMAGVQVEKGTSLSPFVAFAGNLIVAFGRKALSVPQEQSGASAALNALLPIELKPSVNLFDPDNLVANYEISYENGSKIFSGTSALSNPINVAAGIQQITVSGLLPTAYDRHFAWFRFDGSVAGFGYVDKDVTSFTKPRPAGAATFQFDVFRRDEAPASYTKYQVQAGAEATAWEAFGGSIASLGGKTLLSDPSQPRWTGKVIGSAGDSISQITPIDDGVTLYPAVGWTDTNWPIQFCAIMEPKAFHSVARSGASFATWATEGSIYQCFKAQVDKLIALKNNGVVFDMIRIGLGTNDIGSTAAWSNGGNRILGTYADAALIDPDDMDDTIAIQGMWKHLRRLRLAMPGVLIVIDSMIQRADIPLDAMAAWSAEIEKVAGHLACPFVDHLRGSGICGDFEVWNAPGIDLVDGLHTYGMPGEGKLARSKARDAIYRLNA